MQEEIKPRENDKPQTDNAGGRNNPPRLTRLGSGDSDDEFRFSKSRRFPEHPAQQDWLGTNRELQLRFQLRDLLILAWKCRKNAYWESKVKDLIATKRVIKEELDSFLTCTEQMNPEQSELLFPNLPHLSARVLKARHARQLPED